MKLIPRGLKKGEKKWYLIGAGSIAIVGAIWLFGSLVSPGRKHGPLPFPLGGPAPPIAAPLTSMMGPMGPPPMHPGAAAKAHLANIIPPKGPPARSTLGVGGRIAGGIGSGGGMYRWPSGRLGSKGGYGVQGGYYATGY
jgi:hypothetical protein